MAGKGAGVEPGTAGIRLDDVRHRSAGKSRAPHRAALVDRAEERSGLDPGRVQPFPERLDRAGNITSSNRYRDALPFLSGLAVPAGDSQAGFGFLDIGH